MGVDIASADLMYSSSSSKLTFCSTERFMLELHRFLSLKPSHMYVKETWENQFGGGRNWYHRSRMLASFNNFNRPKVLKTWKDLSSYYCIFCMSSFNIHYDKWKMIGEFFPTTPDYKKIRDHAIKNTQRELYFRKKNIYTLPTTEIDNNTLIYFHIPHQYGSYGKPYQWDKVRMETTVKELNLLAAEGYRVCVSGLYERWGLRLYEYDRLFPPDLFHPIYYGELKANRSTEVYYIANF